MQYIQTIPMNDMSLWSFSCSKFRLSDALLFDVTQQVVFISNCFNWLNTQWHRA